MHALIVIAHRRKYDPLRDMLDALPEWDGAPRADTLLSDYLGAENTAYNRAVARLLLNGAVMRAFRPGCKFDYCVVLSSKEGKGKSTFIRKLAMRDRFFTDGLGNISNKEASENIQGKWFVEISELESLQKSTSETTKAFLSRQEDRYRAPYGHFPETRPRRCVFVGTTNSTAFLADRTGNRRFLPVECDVTRPSLDVFGDTSGHISQVWAEVLADYRANGVLPLTLPAEIETDANDQREAFSLDDPNAVVISAWIMRNCKPGERVCSMQIAEQVLNVPRDKTATNSTVIRQITQTLDLLPILKRVGKQRHSSEYGIVRCWQYVPEVEQ